MRIFTSHGDEINLTVGINHSAGLQAKLPKSLEPGTVVDVSRKGQTFARVWVTGNRVFVAHYNGHDVAWDHDVYEYDRQMLIDNGEAEALAVWEIHVFLSNGNGIPPAPIS